MVPDPPPDLARLRRRIAEGSAVLDVRPLTVDDLDDIRWSGSATHLRNVATQLERAAAGEVEYLAVFVDGRPSSKGGVDFAKEAGAGIIFQLATHESLQGLGLATMLTHSLEGRIAARHLRTARLAVEPDNAGAQRLYEHLGYRVIGTSEASWEAERPDGTRYLHTTSLVEMSKTL